LIILDEPINGLDPQGIADIRNLILDLSKNKSKTIFVSSHLLSEIELIADSMLIIDKGKKMAEGKVSQIFDPENTVVELETMNNTATLEKLQLSDWKKYIVPGKRDKILFRLHRQQIPSLTKELVMMGVQVVSLHSQHSLEDYFISLTSGIHHVEASKN
jgi:ABC-type multidrug transport system ATPase subunit